MNKVRRQNRQNSRAEDRERWQSSSIATKRSRSKIQSEGGIIGVLVDTVAPPAPVGYE